MKAVGRYRQQRSPSNPIQNGGDPFAIKIFVGGGMFLGHKIGTRPMHSV